MQDALSLQTHEDKATSAWKASVRKGCSLLLSNWVLYNEVTESAENTTSQSPSLGELHTLLCILSGLVLIYELYSLVTV